MNDEDRLQYDKLEKLLTKAQLPEPSLELEERVTAEATKVCEQDAQSCGGFLFGVCPPQQGPLCWSSGLPFAPVATVYAIAG
jgi:hypothetical protein